MSAGKPRNWFMSFLARYKRSVAIALCLGFLASGCATLLMFTSGYLISATAVAGISLFSIMVPIACVQLFGFGRPLARYLERLVSHDWVLKVTSDLRLMLYRSIEERAGDPARARAVGEYLGLLSDDIAHLQNLYLRVVFPTAIALILAVGATIAFGLFSLSFASVMLLVFALVVLLLPFAALLATRARAEYVKFSTAREYRELVDDVLGAVDWTLSGRGESAIEKHAVAGMRIRAAGSRIRTVQRAVSLASSLALCLAVCVVLIWSGESFGASLPLANCIAGFTIGFFPLIEAFAVLPAAVSEAPAHADAIGRLEEYSLAQTAGSHVREIPDVPDAAASIILDDVSFAYPNARANALEHLTLSIARGENVAVLGRSGSGKSTFARIVRGSIEPSAGRLFRHGSVGYLGQNPYLFNRTLRDNLAIGAPGADDEALLNAIDAVGLSERIGSLPDGLDTVIGETGVGFSGGEAHRLALARVIVADNPIVIVDEPFAALDPQTEESLIDALFEACEHRTLVVITHHLAQIERFDRVVFVENGRIDGVGSPTALMEIDERFRSLVAFDRATAPFAV